MAFDRFPPSSTEFRFMDVEKIFKKIDGAEMRYKQAISKLERCTYRETIENIIRDLTKAHEEIVAAVRSLLL